MISAERWQRIREAYERVAAVPREDRTDALREACVGDPALRVVLEEMFEAGGSSDSLAQVVQRAAATLLDDPPDVRGSPGGDDHVAIDRYLIERRIGEGGMGVVYAASRSDGLLTGQFAVKVLRRGLDTESFVRRFAVERSALERLDHPGIARLVDAGSCADGRPYLVMELVEGRPIDVWCRDEEPSVRERVALFAQVCDAVAYAHSRLVVHRDLKPSNILVTAEGAAKLLDFGIAQILDDEGGIAPATRPGERVLTPRYASPELLDGAPVSTATDVYSLGVVLYELFTGAEPYSVSQRTFAEYGRAVREQTPLPPSAAIAGCGASGSTTRERLATSRRLRGDLDTIVQKAMRKAPEQRYPGAAAMAADLRAHLESRPIAARPESFGSSLRKLARRHPWQVAASGAALVAVLGLSSVSILQARRAALAERESTQAMQEAQSHADTAERFGDFLTEEFLLQLDPARSKDAGLTLEEAVRRAAARIEGRFPDAPLAEALIEHTVGDAFIQRSLYAQAEPHLRRAWRLREEHLGSEAADTLVAKRDLATALLMLERHAESRTLLEEVVAIQSRSLPPDDGLALMSKSILARVLAAMGEDAAAEALYVETYDARRRTLGPRDGNTMSSMNQLGVFYMQRSRFEEALPLFESAEALRRAEFGDDHPRTLIARANLAALHARLGEQRRAVEELRKVRSDQLRVLGPSHGHTLHVLALLCDLEAARGELDAAIELRREQAAALAGDPNASPASRAEARARLVEILLDRGRNDDAAEALDALRSEVAASPEGAPALPAPLRERIDRAQQRLDSAPGGPREAAPPPGDPAARHDPAAAWINAGIFF